MGFSVSGAAAIIFATMFIAFGMWYTAASNSFESVTEARQDQVDGTKAVKNTDIEIASATWDGSTLTVEVDNTGATQLGLNATDLLVDGNYTDGWQASADVAGNTQTDLWLTGERLTIQVDLGSQPDRVKVVADTGVSDTAEVTVL